MKASHKVIFNTLVTYTRAFITVFITLYSTKLIIKALGVEDFGLYSLVGGVVGMLAFFKSALTSSTQRFISYNLGKGLINEVKTVVANSFVIHILTGLLIVLVIEFFGRYMLINNLVIPVDRLDTAVIILHFVVASTFVTIATVPIDSILNAHENMLTLAILGILDSIIKLAIAVSLSYFVFYDKLIIYSSLLFASLITINLIKFIYCYSKYRELRFSFFKDVDTKKIKEQTNFAGWNLFGAACSMGRTHGIAIISNMFFGTIINAAFGIANQVKTQSSFFSATILRAINPQIMKSEGANDRLRMIKLSMMASKFGFILIAFIAIPLIFEMEAVINLWLEKTPKYSVIFCQLILIGTIVEQLTVGIKSAIQSVGKIKTYMIFTGGLILLNMPISYFLLVQGFPAETVLYVFIVLELLAGFLRIYLTGRIIGNIFANYYVSVVKRILLPTVLSVLISYLIVSRIELNYRFILTIVLSSTVFMITVYFNSLSKNEKDIINSLISKVLRK